LTQTTTG